MNFSTIRCVGRLVEKCLMKSGGYQGMFCVSKGQGCVYVFKELFSPPYQYSIYLSIYVLEDIQRIYRRRHHQIIHAFVVKK